MRRRHMIVRLKNLLPVLCILLLAVILCIYLCSSGSVSAADLSDEEKAAKKDQLQEQLAEELREYYIYVNNGRECERILRELESLENQ